MLKHFYKIYIADEIKPMLSLAAPIILAELGWMTMSIVDTMMVGRQADSAVAIGAVSLGSIIYYVVAIFGTGLMLGLDTLVSHSFGAGDMKEVHRSLVNGVYLALGVTPALMGIVWAAEPLLQHLNLQPEILAQTIPYLRTLNWSTLPLLLYFVFRRYLQGINLARPVMFSLVTANAVNVAGNWSLVYGHLGFHAMGTVGSGWSTCLSRAYMATVLMVYCIYYELRYKHGLFEASRLLHLPRVRQLLELGFPAAMQIAFEIGVIATVTAFIGRLGPVPLASHQVALNTVGFSFMVPLGIGSAAAVRVGQALGRKDPHAAGRAGWTAMAIGVVFMFCAALVFWLAPSYIVRVYTSDPSVIAVASGLLFVGAFFQIFDGLQVVATGALRGAGDTRTPMICHLVFYWTVGLPIGYFLCFKLGWGARGFWIGLCVALILIGSILLYIWRRTERAFCRAEVAASAAL